MKTSKNCIECLELTTHFFSYSKIVSIRNSMKVNDKNSNIEQVRKYLFKHINKRCAPDPNNPNDPNKQMLASLFDISQLTSEKVRYCSS